jgi:hypothetical protein
MRSSIPRLDRAADEVPTVAEPEDEAPLSPRSPALPLPPRPALAEADRKATADVSAREGTTAEAAAPAEPRLDFPWRTKPRGDRPGPREVFDRFWPPQRPAQPPAAEAASASAQEQQTAGEAPPPDAQAESASAAPPAPTPAPASEEESPAPGPVAILKSGVVDGMAYTLYADGSIEAKLPEGTVRFGSIAELRAHLEQHS